MNFYSTKVLCISIQWSISNYFSLPKLSYMSSNYCAMYFLIQKYFVKPAIIKQLGISVVSRWG